MNQHIRSLKIVCFGDSLTLGYQSPTLQSPVVENISYGTYLQEWMGARGEIVVRGVCGETTQDMRLRHQRDVLDHQPQMAIILGGTNDLGLGISQKVIMENLSFFFEQAQAHGILPVAVTVPSLQENCWPNEGCEEGQSQSGLSPAVEQAIVQRVMLNQSIKDFGQERHFPVVDWFAETCEPKTQALAPQYSNDGLHLTAIGYRKLAEMIWEQVLEDLLEEKTPTSINKRDY